MKELEIRDARLADAEPLAEIQVAAWQKAYADILPPSILEPFTVEHRRQRWEAILDEPEGPATTMVGVRDGEPIGFVSYGPSRDEDLPESGEIWALYARPRVWKTGVGRDLTAVALERLRADGFDSACLWVLRDNAIGRRFYETAGFRLDGATKVELHDGDEMPMVRYVRALDE